MLTRVKQWLYVPLLMLPEVILNQLVKRYAELFKSEYDLFAFQTVLRKSTIGSTITVTYFQQGVITFCM